MELWCLKGSVEQVFFNMFGPEFGLRLNNENAMSSGALLRAFNEFVGGTMMR